MSERDIVIIGGGMVGASLAVLLAVALPQRRIALVESFPMPAAGEPVYQPSYDDRSTAIAQGSVYLLQQAGVWPQLQRYATVIEQVHVSDRGHIGGTLIDRREVGAEALGYVIPNAWIGRVLLSHLQQCANIELIAPASVTRLRPVAGGAELLVAPRDGEPYTLTTALAVIADGADSPLRQALGIECRVQEYDQTAIIANVGLDRSHHHVAYERFTDEGPMALLPLAGDSDCRSAALVWTQPAAQADEILSLPDEQFLARLQDRFGHRLGRFVSVGKRDAYPLALMLAAEQVRSSIVVLGNAAHFMHPVAGQGFNLALRDAAVLVETLMQAAADESPGSLKLLQRYLQRQQHDQDTTVFVSDQLSKWFSSNRLPPAALRGLGLLGLELLPPAKDWFTRQTMGSAGKFVQLPLR
ncbi:2-octaprenyl-6-methoxyphenyl hydroxylase [Pseudomaricurvus sp. HS19]|uniref:2-octaprenyl-6-methoxyphenyl hydroxylase n=1 Tax=Pseudomaricurvus sp. HS19 TaxID=2692626 RepID=UPI001F02C52D|nr:2-octaprenyl-6-methoxyphenyl hydroxylase [Pseudomaricurvus sp. HS19]